MSFKEGDPVIYNDGDTEYEGEVQDIRWLHAPMGDKPLIEFAVVYFPNDGPNGKKAMLIPVNDLRKKPQWRRVEGKLRIRSHRDGYPDDTTVLAHDVDEGFIYVEQLIEEES